MVGPDKIMIMRHAEKPEPGGPTGVNERGAPDEHSLTVRGWQRAGALVAFFGTPTRPEIQTPGTIVASIREATVISGEETNGLRAQQTVAPLRARIGGNYWEDIAVGQEDVLIERLKGENGGVVLVSWMHKRIHNIVAGLIEPPAPEWTDGRFDAVWVLDRASGTTYRLRMLNQDLLAGDQPA